MENKIIKKSIFEVNKINRFNYYGFSNIFNMICNKNKKHFNGITTKNIDNTINISVNKLISKYIKKHNKIKKETILLNRKMLSYFELYLPQKQIDVINDVLKNKIELIFEIYQILLQKLSKIVRIINTLKSTYKTFYYYCTLNIHNQIKYIIKSLTKLLKAEVNNSKKYKEINKIIKKCNKLRDKYIKTLKELYKDESIYKLFKKVSDNKINLISNNKKYYKYYS